MDFGLSFLFGQEEKRCRGSTTREEDVENQVGRTGASSSNADKEASDLQNQESVGQRIESLIGSLAGKVVSLKDFNRVPDIEASPSEDSTGRNSDTSGTESETSDSSDSEGRGRSRTRASRSRRQRKGEKTNPKRKQHEFTSHRPDAHFYFFSHGLRCTTVGIVFAWLGFAFSYSARNSSAFVDLETPIYLDANFNEVGEIGMVNFQLCYNETFTGQSGCHSERLESDDISDRMFEVARSMAFLAILLGGFMSVFMTVATFWQSINLKPVGFGFLIAYFMQSFTFLFYDSKMCATYKCHVSLGTVYSIVASFCWLFACIATARMDSFKSRTATKQQLEKDLSRSPRPRSKSRSRSPKKIIRSPLSRKVSDTSKTTEDLRTPGQSPINIHPEVLPSNPTTTTRNGAGVTYINGIADVSAVKAWRGHQSHSPHSTTSDNESVYIDEEKCSPESFIVNGIDSPVFDLDFIRTGRSPELSKSTPISQSIATSRNGDDSPATSTETPTVQNGRRTRSKRRSRRKELDKRRGDCVRQLQELPKLDHPIAFYPPDESPDGEMGAITVSQAELSPRRFTRVLSGKTYEL